MLKEIRQQIIASIWQDYRQSNHHVQQIEKSLQKSNINVPALDHLAIIDLPGPHTGIKELSRIFSALGFVVRGKDYLPEKVNDFAWLAEEDSEGTPAHEVLPQIVAADFRLHEMPEEVRTIILKYSSQAKPSPAVEIEILAKRAANYDVNAANELTQLTLQYLKGREWPLPSVQEFKTVREYNELIAWVLVFGRKPNHFTLSIHLMPEFETLADFHHFVEHNVGLALNHDGGVIKGGVHTGIEQGSTAGTPETILLADGSVEIPTGFVEFVWRFKNNEHPVLWNDYFTGFVANHANRVIQSLYTAE
ncbi:MAG TPA: DUF1338 family protein [Gammaproteobacteria bacterium]|nr:DUF1338 family protein [Gammaproteobacteria bacterium]